MANRHLIATLTLAVGALAACGPAANAGGTAVPIGTAAVTRTDIVSRQQLPGTLTYAGAYTIVNQAGPGVYTRVPASGTVVTRGQVLYRVDDRPIPMFFGDPEWRRLSVWVPDGADVHDLQANLVALGFGAGLHVDNHFDWVTAAAVRRWQAALGIPQTGVVNLGDVVYEPGPIRVTVVHAGVGMTAQPSQPLAEATSTQHAVLLPVDVSRAPLVKIGDQVTVALPDGKSAASGTVSQIGTVATAPPGGNDGGAGRAPLVAMVTVTIVLADPAAGGNLDQAPVNVAIAYDTHKAVLAVPVMALLAQPGGEYKVIVVEGAQRRNVTVVTGLFDERGLVEVSSPDLREGLLVEVPAT